MQIPTVNIQHGKDDYAVINEADFDKSKHKLFVEKEEKNKDDKKPEDDKNPKDDK